MKYKLTNPIVFIIRIWSEPREIEGASPEMKGALENLATGERSYFVDLDTLIRLIVKHMKASGLDHIQE